MTHIAKSFVIFAVATFFSSLLFAAEHPTYSSVVVFGDSFSDNGNLYRIVDEQTPLVPADGQPPMPYFFGRYSNGPLAVELLAQQLGVPLTDFAIAGATTGFDNEDPRLPGTGMLAQVHQAIQQGRFDANALYVVWGGANDFSTEAALLDPDTAPRAITNLKAAIKLLYQHGARHILVPNMPNFGLTPNLQAQGPAAVSAATDQTANFNSLLASQLSQLSNAFRYVDIRTYDIAALLNDAYVAPGKYGLADVATPCVHQLADGTVVIDDEAAVANSFNAGPAGGHLFWDDFHPTYAAHKFLAEKLLEVVSK